MMARTAQKNAAYPFANLKFIEDLANNFPFIMKDGKVFKNTVK